MRSDLFGLFWDDTPMPKPPRKEKEKRTPPERTWEREDYLPYLDEARRFPVVQFTDERLWEAALRRDPLLFDIECYPNYFLVGFMSTVTGEVTYVEMDEETPLDIQKLGWILTSFPIFGFNSNGYDIPIATLALAGWSNVGLKDATNAIIQQGERGYEILKRVGITMPQYDHVDLIEVAPLSASLKIYGGRLHAPRMQELPFPVDRMLTRDQKTVVRWYCIGSDLVSTGFVWHALGEQRALRNRMSAEHGIDLRSKSDAQIAEAVIMRQLRNITRKRYSRPEIPPGTIYRYNTPHFLKFNTPLMQGVLQTVQNSPFVVSEKGTIRLDPRINGLEIPIGHSTYRMAGGGMHSTEMTRLVVADEKYKLKDIDVESYYPRIALILSLYPQHLGTQFLHVYGSIIEARLAAKARKDKATAESLKITVNGTYGKFSQPGSYLYAPELGFHITITGQLALLMLIERLELAGFSVISGNTDGIVIYCERVREAECDAIVRQWEKDVDFKTEETEYVKLASRDVNNYIAVKPDGKTKTKGAFANPWADMKDDAKAAVMRFHKNPVTTICIEAAIAFLIKGTSPMETIRACKDVRRFVAVRHVKGGAVQAGDYLGKAVRWYYSTNSPGEMVYALSGNKVPRSEGTRPLLDLPEALPDDIDFIWYENETLSILHDIGAIDLERERAEVVD